MGYRIKANDLIIEVDTQDEFSAALRVIRALDEKHERHQRSERRESPLFSSATTTFSEKPSLAGLSNEERLSEFFKYVKTEDRGNMLKFIKALATTSDFIAPKEIAEISGIDFEGIGGTVGSISKIAKRFGLTRDDIMVRQHSRHGSRFQLTPAIRDVVQADAEVLERKAYVE